MSYKFWTIRFWQDFGYGLGSGPYLVKKIVNVANLDNIKTIIELGAGEGQVTGEILSKKSIDTRLIVIENDHESFLKLQEKYGEYCEIYEMSAAHIDTLVEIESVDMIISTLPLGSISRSGVDSILVAVESVLVKGGIFVQYQYALQNLKDVKKYFVLDRIFFEPRNFWPAFIYRTHKK